MKTTIIISTLVLLLVAFVGYASVQANSESEPEPTKVEKKVDKSKCFCNGLSLPPERQCPTMDDLDNGIILR
jgi:hypothetical protein